MLSRLPVSLAHLKAGNNSEKFKIEVRQLLHSLYRSKKMCKSLISIYLKHGNNFYEQWKRYNERTTQFKLDLTDKRNLKDPNKNIAFANLSIYYTW